MTGEDFQNGQILLIDKPLTWSSFQAVNKLKYLMTLLINNTLPLPAVYKDHPLQGSWKGYRDAHVEPDWILIYKLTDKLLRFERTGTHAALFG